MNRTNMTLKLVEAAREGDKDAYDQLFALAGKRALQFIRMRLGQGLREKVDSMDILQEAYLQALRDFQRFEYEGDDAFARWLCRIIENRIRGDLDYFKAKKRKPEKSEHPVSLVLSKVWASDTGVVTQAGRKEMRQKLEQAMEELSPDEREILLLRFYQDRTIDEIANLVGRSPTSVRRFLGRCALRLGQLLEVDYEG